jgi:hypothetical protein
MITMYMAYSLLVTLLCPTSVVAVNMVDIIDYTHIVIKDVLNGSYHSSIRQKPNQGKHNLNSANFQTGFLLIRTEQMF